MQLPSARRRQPDITKQAASEEIPYSYVQKKKSFLGITVDSGSTSC